MRFEGKMNSLNYAINDMLPHLVSWERRQEQVHILVRVLAFSDQPQWHVTEPTRVGQLRWTDLQAVERGRTNMGPAFRAVAAALGRIENRATRPALLLITDGLPTDNEGQFETGLQALLSVPAGASALRLAVAIGRDANSEPLSQFIGDPAIPVLVADRTDQIADRLVAASLAVSRMSEAGADRAALATQLLSPDDEII
jgi:uncharacterized protein YegL